MSVRYLSLSPTPRLAALLLTLPTLAGLEVLQAGDPPEAMMPEPVFIPEEAYSVPLPQYRNPRNRFGIQGGLTFGVRAEFVAEAFTGTGVDVFPGGKLEDIIVDDSRTSADENGGVGGEIFYERILGESDLSEGVNEVWGLHVGGGFGQIEIDDTVPVNAFRRANSGGPGPFLDQGAMKHDLEADLWYVNLGLFKESYLTDRFYAKVGGGLSVAYIDAEYLVTGPFDFAADYADETDLLFGGYVDLTLGYDLSRNWSVFAGIRYQYLTPFEMEGTYSDLEMKFDQSFMAFLGVRFAF